MHEKFVILLPSMTAVPACFWPAERSHRHCESVTCCGDDQVIQHVCHRCCIVSRDQVRCIFFLYFIFSLASLLSPKLLPKLFASHAGNVDRFRYLLPMPGRSITSAPAVWCHTYTSPPGLLSLNTWVGLLKKSSSP
jgi:hypothetical protein